MNFCHSSSCMYPTGHSIQHAVGHYILWSMCFYTYILTCTCTFYRNEDMQRGLDDSTFDLGYDNGEEEERFESKGFTRIEAAADGLEKCSIAYISTLRQLATLSPPTYCTEDGCHESVSIREKFQGTAVHLLWVSSLYEYSVVLDVHVFQNIMTTYCCGFMIILTFHLIILAYFQIHISFLVPHINSITHRNKVRHFKVFATSIYFGIVTGVL